MRVPDGCRRTHRFRAQGAEDAAFFAGADEPALPEPEPLDDEDSDDDELDDAVSLDPPLSPDDESALVDPDEDAPSEPEPVAGEPVDGVAAEDDPRLSVL